VTAPLGAKEAVLPTITLPPADEIVVVVPPLVCTAAAPFSVTVIVPDGTVKAVAAKFAPPTVTAPSVEVTVIFVPPVIVVEPVEVSVTVTVPVGFVAAVLWPTVTAPVSELDTVMFVPP